MTIAGQGSRGAAVSDPSGAAAVDPRRDDAASLQRELSGLRVDNDALRGDIDRLFAELDEARADVQALREARTRVAALETDLREIRVAQRRAAADRAEREAVFAAERRAHADQVGALTAQLVDAAHLAHVRSADADAASYRTGVAAHTHELVASIQRDRSEVIHRVAHDVEGARLVAVGRAGRLEALLAATVATVSWRITQPLRAVRSGWNTAIARVSRGRWGVRPHLLVPDPPPVRIPPLPEGLESVHALDVEHYRRCYPGLATLSDHELLEHYHRFGRAEGRSALSPLRRSRILTETAPEAGDGSEDHEYSVLVVMAPDAPADLADDGVALIRELARKCRVVSVFGSGMEDLRIASLPGTRVVLTDPATMVGDDITALAAELVAFASPRFAVNAAAGVSRVVHALQQVDVPVLTLDQVSEVEPEPEPPRRDARHEVPHRFRYAIDLEELEARVRRARAQHTSDLETILVPRGVDEVYANGGAPVNRRLFAENYLRQVRLVSPLRRPNSVPLLVRPRPGFHPLSYAESVEEFLDDGRDPLAHFLAQGEPSGRWSRRLITPSGVVPTVDADLSVLIHGHFYYPELVTEFLDLLAPNTHPVTVALTTHSEAAAREVEGRARAHAAGRTAIVRVVPNRGRNFSALLTGTVADLIREHNVVLHVHGKRSPHAPNDFGDRWRRRLWTNLVGDGIPFADRIIAEFAADPMLGMVAPEELRLHDWDGNREFAPAWIDRLQLNRRAPMPLPVHFDFAVGAMFWARSAALAPLLDAELTGEDFPAEPLPTDGTSLHALERLISLIVEHEGFEFAKTYLGDPAFDVSDTAGGAEAHGSTTAST
ncbi:rhamnan synthesis F family protein [Leucobacter rhizosphaerae]|uniref:Rhamnan synthesis F family protein n=1 Tax=Leucobacter rhizosphaerae TaxID=2932245 RepID=A0ABY4FUT0_9MICO|nr:rhamnan synthesis F family protein [Leucobacter rhizosphaerae]UOQ60064.1 rhamnan synthesis F family protein [Leucobacter rhizosphaerae]